MKENKQLWTIVGISLVVAIVVLIATFTISNNVFLSPENSNKIDTIKMSHDYKKPGPNSGEECLSMSFPKKLIKNSLGKYTTNMFRVFMARQGIGEQETQVDVRTTSAQEIAEGATLQKNYYVLNACDQVERPDASLIAYDMIVLNKNLRVIAYGSMVFRCKENAKECHSISADGFL